MGKRYDLINNPSPRLPCALVLDVSGSMAGPPIDELNKGVRQYVSEIKEDEFAAHSIEVAVILFGGKVVAPSEFRVASDLMLSEFYADGTTPMGEAVSLALDMLEKRKNEYKQSGVSYYQPWIILMTDGEPKDDYKPAAARLKHLGSTKKATVFGIGVGPGADMSILSEFCPPDRPPIKLSGIKFKEFFAWLSQSQQGVSRSVPGEDVATPDVSPWAF